MSPVWSVPRRIETERLVIRAYEAERDVEPLHRLVLSSIDHLRPFIPWAANEPLTVEQRRTLLRQYERNFTAGERVRDGLTLSVWILGA